MIQENSTSNSYITLITPSYIKSNEESSITLYGVNLDGLTVKIYPENQFDIFKVQKHTKDEIVLTLKLNKSCIFLLTIERNEQCLMSFPVLAL